MDLIELNEPYVKRSSRVFLNGLLLANGMLLDYIETPPTQIELSFTVELGDSVHVDYLPDS